MCNLIELEELDVKNNSLLSLPSMITLYAVLFCLSFEPQ